MKNFSPLSILLLLGLTAGLLLSFPASSVFAYTDQVTVKAEEAWQAALEVLKPHGIKKMNAEKKVLETKWKTDVVRRSRGPLKNFTSKTMDRRYRFRVSIIQRDYDSEIEVRGYFQERAHEDNSHLFMWEKSAPDLQDFDLERSIFMQILTRLEIAKREAAGL